MRTDSGVVITPSSAGNAPDQGATKRSLRNRFDVNRNGVLMNRLTKIRRQLFAAQEGRCFYCLQPMWEDNRHDFAIRYAIGKRRTVWLQSTAEHLLARCDGGSDDIENIVAACRFCNQHRHRSHRALPCDLYVHHVRKRLAKGAWHGLRLR